MKAYIIPPYYFSEIHDTLDLAIPEWGVYYRDILSEDPQGVMIPDWYSYADCQVISLPFEHKEELISEADSIQIIQYAKGLLDLT